MAFLHLPDAELHYETAGERGTPVLLIMGFGVPGRMWRNQIPALAARHRVAWFDNCGAGQTRRTGRRPYSARDLGRHAAGLLDHLGWTEAHVVGVSMGGMIAQQVALEHRARVRSLALLVTHGGSWRDLLPGGRALALFARGFLGPRAQRAGALEQLIFPPEYLATVDRGLIRRALRDEVVAAAPLGGRLGQIAAVLSHRPGRRLRELDGLPTLVVAGGQDALIHPRACERLHRAIPGSRLVVLEEAGHAVLLQCAERINRELLDHFGAVDAAPIAATS